MNNNGGSGHKTGEALDESTKSFMTRLRQLEQYRQAHPQDSAPPKTRPRYPVRKCENCDPEKGLHQDWCYFAFATTLKGYSQAINERLIPNELKLDSTPGDPSHQAKPKSHRSETASKHHSASQISADLHPHPTSIIDNLNRHAAAFQFLNMDSQEKEAIAVKLHQDMESYYHDGSHDLFDAWQEACEAAIKVFVESEKVRQEMEEMMERLLEAQEERRKVGEAGS